MNKLPILLLLIIAALPSYAQKPLSTSRTNSYQTFIYRIDDETVKKLYTGQPLNEDVLKYPVDSFLTGRPYTGKLAAGNYLKLSASQNNLTYSLLENRTANVQLLHNGHDLQFILTDRNRKRVKDAQVWLGRRKISYDEKADLWKGKYPHKEKNLLEIRYENVSNFSNLNKEEDNRAGFNFKKWFLWKSPFKYVYLPFRRTYYNIKNGNVFAGNYRSSPVKHSSGYIVFNKPIYKPLDTVKLKAFLLRGKQHRPQKKELEVQLLGGDLGKKVLGKVAPDASGSYTYTFVLKDSLKLHLDKNYRIAFYNKKKLIKEGYFRYEEYELKSTSFTMRGQYKEHSRREPQSLYFRALDENGLNVLDGRVELLITRNTVNSYHTNSLFIPDTLWKHTFKLEALGETKVVLPDSIFPEAAISYSAEATFLNSNNEEKTAEHTYTFLSENNGLKFEMKNDSLEIALPATNVNTTTKFKISAVTANDDTLETFSRSLPCRIKVNPLAAEYDVEGAGISDFYDMEDAKPEINAISKRTVDSVFITVSNPQKIPFWYTVFKGRKVVDRGSAIDLNYKKRWAGNQDGSFRLSFVWAGKTEERSVPIHFAEKELRLEVAEPLAVAPGEKSHIELTVKNAKGKPAKNANVTAFSITSKFNYTLPAIPYFGRQLKNWKQKEQLETDEGINGKVKLNWQRWALELGLDSVEYYRFTHPVNTYRNLETSNDGITQIAPFVISEGEILPVRILYIDDKPVYFDQSDQLRRYSFKVPSGLVKLKFRLADRIIEPEAVLVVKGKRLVVSFDADPETNKIIRSTAAPLTLSDTEAHSLNRYLISVEDTYTPRFATIKGPEEVFLLKGTNSYSGFARKIVGPLSYNYNQFQVKGEEPVNFEVEPNYVYTFKPGLIRQKSINEKYPFNPSYKSSTAPPYTERVLTNHDVDSLWLDYLNLRAHTTELFPRMDYNGPEAGQLKIKLPEKLTPLVTSVLLYKKDNLDFLNIYPGREINLGQLERGSYRLMLLLKNDCYILKENIAIKPYGVNLIAVDFENVHPKDSTSAKIARLIQDAAMAPEVKSTVSVEQIKESFNQQYADRSLLNQRMSGRVLDRKTRKPLIGVSVQIKNVGQGTVTNINGEFNLRVPASGKLVISYIGYSSQEVEIVPGFNRDIYLEMAANSLSEVVVIGYGKQQKGAIEQSLQGRLAGVDVQKRMTLTGSVIRIRGTASLSGNTSPLYVVDGILVEDGTKSLKPEEIAEITTLENSTATALYGARAAGGVIIVTTKKGKEKAADEAAESLGTNRAGIRRNFSDYAFWQPSLRTDQDGKVKFTVKFPDDITNWRTFFIAIDGNKQSGYTENSVKAYKPVSATFVSPQFAVKGDRFSPLGKIANYTTQSVSVFREFSYNNNTVLSNELDVKNSHVDTFALTATGKDSLTFRYSIKKEGGYADGEERKIPLLEAGSLETKGTFEALESDTTILLRFDPQLGKVNFRAEASLFPVLLDEIEHLRNYQYFCNEQLASKLKALLLQKKITTYLRQPFEHKRVVEEIIKRLSDNRISGKGWGWWKEGNFEPWIGLHVMEALSSAAEAGFELPFHKREFTDFLIYQLSDYKGTDKLDLLLMLEKLKEHVDYKTPLQTYERETKTRKFAPSLYERFKLLYLKQKAGEQIMVDSVLRYKHFTMFGNVYFGEPGYHFFNNSIQTTVLAYRIIRADGRHPELLTKIRNYFLEQRQDNKWRNTYESCLILETIIPDLLKDGSKERPVSISLTAAATETINQFPYTTTLNPTAQLTIKKQGNLPVYISAWQQFWNPKPDKVSKDFKVDTWFENKAGAKITSLKGGSAVTLKALVHVKAEAEFVMIEIPVPAGCSYEEKEQHWFGPEVHREYFKNKVSIFCRKLREGDYTFNVKLMPRYSGDFLLNPAKAEMMYFPVFYGREEMKLVNIK